MNQATPLTPVSGLPFLNRIRLGGIPDFGDLVGELNAMSSGNFVADVSHWAVLKFDGDDAQKFLQSQLSCDVDKLAGGTRSGYGAYCSPKGRMLASFLLWQQHDGWRMVMSRSIVASIHKRLGMYVLRAKVRISDQSGTQALIGAGGTEAIEDLRAWAHPLPREPHGIQVAESATIIALPGQRWLLVTDLQAADSAWQGLAAKLVPVGTTAWDASEIRNGIPWVTARTQDQFVPQMANMDLIGGVSFRKGCYPGQEIVARSQYLGKVKRRLYLASVAASARAGDELFSDDVHGQANGTVVNAAPAPDGGCTMLAVVQSESADNSRVHLGTSDGPALTFLQLPYPTAKPE